MKSVISNIPKTVWVLGLVSMFMDISSEIIHALLPIFMTSTLGISVAMVGLVDGIAEATASITKVFSGYVSDRMGKRKPLILIGYGIGAFSKPLFALAGTAPTIIGARFADRIGKGLRGAPRDALVADVTPPEIRGRAFGLRQSMDTAGAFLGPLIAIAAMAAFGNNIRAVFWLAVIPAAVSVMLVLVAVQDAKAPFEKTSARVPIRMADLRHLPNAFWLLIAIGAVFTLARFSEAFLILKAHAEGLPITLTPLVLVAMNAVYMLAAYPFGSLSDRVSAKSMLIGGLMVLVAADLVLAMAPGTVGAFVGIALWGVHMAATQGLFAKLVADSSPPRLRGSAYGLFNLATGLALLASSVIAGVVWDTSGPAVTFLVGAGCAVLAIILTVAGGPLEGARC